MKRRKYQKEYFEFLGLQPETKQGIFGVVLITLGLLSLLSFMNWAGLVGSYFDHILSLLFGLLKFIFPIIILWLGYVLLRPNIYIIRGMNYFGLSFIVLSLTALTHLYYPLEKLTVQAKLGLGGGWIGVVLSYPLLKFTSFLASIIILTALLVISILITFNTTFERLSQHSKIISIPLQFILFPFKKLSNLRQKDKNKKDNDEEQEQEKENENEEENEQEEENISKKRNFVTRFVKGSKKNNKENEEIQVQSNSVHRPKIDLPLNLLDNKISKPTTNNTEDVKEKINKTFENFGIEVEMGEHNIGPTVTQYTLRPSSGIKLNKITALNNDLSLSLAAYPIRIEAPIPGKSLVGIEVPNKSAAMVTLREVLESKSFKEKKSDLTIGLGKDVKGKVLTAALDKMPHLLIAGSTGSGKSVCVNDIIVSLLYQNGPDDLKFIMVDPKRVELKGYDGIPHLITPVITDVKKTINALKWTLKEMDRRFDLLSKCGHRNIKAHNAESESKLSYIVFIIDELSDLMAVAASDVEAAIIRLSQMARAVGIHLILATQRPSVDVITGLIKANITSRIAFSVASLMDSRTILDTSGAEKLIGKGDMLFLNAELSKPKRIQGAYVSDTEIKKIVNYLKEQGEPDYADEIVEKQLNDPVVDFESHDDDELLEEAKEILIRAGKASASLLQRRLKIGYARAARLLDMLEERSIIGPSQGAKPREILVGEEVLSINQSYGEILENKDNLNKEEEVDV